LKQTLGSVTLIPSAGGRFEVTLGKEVIYSKLRTGTFPDPDEIVAQIRSRLEK
jgi:selenoprotein W-related protein